MEKRCIVSPNAPPAAGPYSHAVIAGGFVFVSGQVALDPGGGGPRKGSFEEEARLALSNLKAILEDCGTSLEHVVKVTAFLSDMDNFAQFNTIYKEFFPAHYPARTCIQAGRLPLDFQVEVEAIAVLPK
ncbi:MAG TPA: Rid family detoxifying hydrolase [Candidatus Hydrogenedentes bacterium]|nr:Rid family detoxifying hydrolase [Candidatus Hydrogenedentota bacterium]HOL76644.1 Rid family detoxifying hydrolase [Candidatus Hydrogenedentota bacterium]HPO84477.1 Rid family detoxifying hydrolase [Candidatus Hydrogenedentota bacterium]